MWFRRLLATLVMSMLLAPALAQDQQSVALQFLVNKLGLPATWKPEVGSSPPLWKVEKKLFGLNGVILDSISAAAAVADKPTGAITANLSIGGAKFSGTLGSQAGTGGPEEVWIQLTGEGVVNVSQLITGVASRYTAVPKLNSVQLKYARVGFRPGSNLGYLSGVLVPADNDPWKGNVAVTVVDALVSLFVQADEVDLQALFKPAPLVELPKLPQSVLMFNSATGQAPALANLPLPVQAMFSAVTRGLPLPDAFPMGEGFGVWSRVTAQQLRIPAATPLKLPAMLIGGEVNPGQSVSLAALIASNFGLRNWRFDKPSFYFSHKQTEGQKFGVKAIVAMPLGRDSVSLNGDLAIETKTGALAFTGTLDELWSKPFGLERVSIPQGTGVTFSLDIEGTLGLGVQGGLSIDGVTSIKNNKDDKDGKDDLPLVCVNADLKTGLPVVNAVGLRFAADSLDPAVALRLVNGFVQYAANGPPGSAMGKLASGGQRISALKGKEVGAALTGVPLPKVDGARFYLVTPGLTCDLPANAGMGAALAGAVSFMGQPLASTDSGFNLDKGFWLGGNIQSFSVGKVFSLSSAKVDVAAPMPTSPSNIADTRFRINGGAKLAFFEGDLVVNFSKDGVRFDTDAALSDFFKASLQAASVGAKGNPTVNLADATDFKLSLAATADTAALRKEILKGMAVALQPKASARRDDAKAKRPSPEALADAKAEADKLNKDVGEVYFALLTVVSNANDCLNGDGAACKRLANGAAKAAEELASAADRLKAMAGDIERWGRAESKWAALAFAEQAGKASEELWNGFLKQLDNLVKDVTGAASIVSIDRVAFDGFLTTGKGTLAVDVKLDPRTINKDLATASWTQTFPVSLGKSVAPSSGKGGGYDALSEAVAKGYAGLGPPATVPRAPSATALSWEAKDGLFTLTAKVASDLVRQESGGAVRPGGTLTLYRVGKDGKGVKVASSTELNQKGNCNNPVNIVRFPAPAGSGCSTPAAPSGGAFALKLDPGANVFYVEYAGDAAYLASTSKSIVITAAASCGKLEKLAGATVRIARAKAGSSDALDYVSSPSVVNAELGNNAQLYFFDKKLHASSAAGVVGLWDLVFRLRQVPGSDSQYYIETVRDCAATSSNCTRLVAPAADPVLTLTAKSSTAQAWTLTNTGKGQFQFSTTTGCPKGAATCYLGGDTKPTAVGEPNSPKTLGNLVMQAAPATLMLEEVCAGK